MQSQLESPPDYPILIVSPNANVDSYYTLEHLQIGAVNRAKAVVHTAGGKGNNMARASRCLGGQILSLGIVGGTSGQFIAQELVREGIPHDLVWTNHETRRSSTLIDVNQMQTTVILDPGHPIDMKTGQELLAKTRQYAAHADYLVLTGSLLPGLHSSYYADFIRAMVDFPRLKVCLDCSGEVLIKAAEAGAFMIKINALEFSNSFLEQEGFEVNRVLPVFQQLQMKGTDLLIITNGPMGAYIFSSLHPPFHVQTHVDRLVTTVGAGDTFLAGLLLALKDGRNIEEAACFASAAAAANLQQVVCGRLAMEDVNDFLARTDCIPLIFNTEKG